MRDQLCSFYSLCVSYWEERITWVVLISVRVSPWCKNSGGSPTDTLVQPISIPENQSMPQHYTHLSDGLEWPRSIHWALCECYIHACMAQISVDQLASPSNFGWKYWAVVWRAWHQRHCWSGDAGAVHCKIYRWVLQSVSDLPWNPAPTNHASHNCHSPNICQVLNRKKYWAFP